MLSRPSAVGFPPPPEDVTEEDEKEDDDEEDADPGLGIRSGGHVEIAARYLIITMPRTLLRPEMTLKLVAVVLCVLLSLLNVKLVIGQKDSVV